MSDKKSLRDNIDFSDDEAFIQDKAADLDQARADKRAEDLSPFGKKWRETTPFHVKIRRMEA